MTQTAQAGAYQDAVSVFIARNSVELAAIRAAFDNTDIPFHWRPLGLTQALAVGQAPDERYEIQVSEVHVDAAMHILKPFGASDPTESPSAPITLVPSPEDQLYALERERRRRILFALVFLVPFLPPLSFLVSLLNANRWLQINTELEEPTQAPFIVRTIGAVALLGTTLWTYGPMIIS